MPRSVVARLLSAGRTIRGRIWIAFAATSLITGALGLIAANGTNRAGTLVEKTYDQSLMAINYARAASADFSEMELAAVRESLVQSAPEGAQLAAEIEELYKSLAQDLSIAATRAQSERAAAAAQRALEAAKAWRLERLSHLRTGMDAGSRSLDPHSNRVRSEIELLVNYTAGDGFLYRQSARQIVAQDRNLSLLGALAAVLLSSLTAYVLVRRITGAIAGASEMAARIAAGHLGGELPPHERDELGALVEAMDVMRGRIRSMMEREVAQRESAQARLADALEGSQAGIIMIGADQRIALVNSQAVDFFADSPVKPLPGLDLSHLAGPLLDAILTSSADSVETVLGDGRHVRVTRSATREGGFIAVCSDISELWRQQEQLLLTNANLDAALTNMSQGLCMYDAQGRLRVVNRRFAELFRLPSEMRCLGLSTRELINLIGLTDVAPLATLVELIALDHPACKLRPGETGFITLPQGRVLAVYHQNMAGGGWVATYEDVTERKKAEEQISFLARHDALTSLPNRRLLAECVEGLFREVPKGVGFGLLCLDLDGFKDINDTMGHPAGDELLLEVAHRLQACVRDTDMVCRLGGDEFAIVQTGGPRVAEAETLARRVIAQLAEPFTLRGGTVAITTSVGIAMAPDDGENFSALLRNADIALYASKEDGGGTWRLFQPEMEERQQTRRQLESDLRRALSDDEFELNFQPLYDLRTQAVTGFEALVRWRHPERGLVSPLEFIPCCEETGMIHQLGAWVLLRACREAMTWPQDVKVAVNVSPVQFRSADLVEVVRAALADSGLSPGRLELEITESVLLAGGAALETLQDLRALGCRISMDDFGTGYSSLSYLQNFAFDKIKIDRSFIRDLASPDGSQMIVRTILGLASGLGVRVTAEGVETAEQLAWLATAGCDEIQGYLISKPVPGNEIADGLKRWGLLAAPQRVA